jgi:serine/threonine protein kinase
VLGRYRLRRRLGTGGFATVWLARDERLDRDVAIKILPRGRIVGGRFEREARAAARLAHPGIVTLYEAAVDDEGAYLVSELVHGATLNDLLSAGRLSDRDLVRIGIDLCDALAHAHAHGVIHRDVKPSNVLIPEHPTTAAQLARLTDFGVAKLLGSPPTRGETLTRTGEVIGTAAYMAPEQAQGLPAGAGADLFSLALVLYEALGGVNPLRVGQGGRARAGMHLPPLRRQRRELPRELGRAIDLALRPRPSERGSLEELRSALVATVPRVTDEPGVVAAPWPVSTRTPHPETATRDEPEGRPRRAPGVARRRSRTAVEPMEEGAHDRNHAHPTRPARVTALARALAGVAAALLTVWLARRVPGASPLPSPLLACLAGALVAALPRLGWLAATGALAGALVAHSRPGGALLVLAGGLIPAALAPRDGTSWPLAVVAPMLSATGLATAWPALAGFAYSMRRRVVLAVTGWLWIALSGHGLATATSLHDATRQAIAPLLTIATPASCAVWAAAAVILPWTRIRRSRELEYIRVAAWATALALATTATAAAGSAGAPMSVGAALLGAYLGGFVAIITRRVIAAYPGIRPTNDRDPTA